MDDCLFGTKRRLQAPKCWFLAPSGARNQHFENPRLQFPENLNLIAGQLLETTQKPSKNSKKLSFGAQRRLQAPKCWFLAPSGARNQHFENSRLEFPENPNIISGKLLETT